MQTRQQHILFYSIIAMMVSLFVSRVALSVGVGVFVLLCFFHGNIKEQLRHFFSSPLLWGMSLLFLFPLVSGLWSEDKKEWLNIVRVKLPLLVLPLAFAAPFSFSKKQWYVLASVFISLIVAGTLWSMFQYAGNMDAVNEGYLHAKSIRTPLENDHVRFSWLVSLAVLVTGWLWWSNRIRKHSSWWWLIILWLIVFLHILAVRTGLLCFYSILLAITLWIIFKKAKPVFGAGMLVLLIALPVAAYYLLPTFQNKVKYINYDFEFLKDAHYLPGGNDATRVISIKAGWHVMKNHAVTGVGFGDIAKETVNWYDVNYPQMQQTDKILPSNEWLMYGAGGGITGILIFTFVMLVPFFIRVKYKWPWRLLHFLVAISFLSDIGLEVQFGVFSYSFIVLICWKWFRSETLKA